MATNSLIAYLEKKYGVKGTKDIVAKFNSQKARYVEQGKK